jgi:hypothetical protein
MTLIQDPTIHPASAIEQHLHRMLAASLPPPATDSPEALHERNEAALAVAASLAPATVQEADLAARFTAAAAHAEDRLRLAGRPNTDLAMRLKLTAQAATLMRQSQQAMNALLRLQELRMKRGKNAPAAAAVLAKHIPAPAATGQTSSPVPAPRQPAAAPARVPPGRAVLVAAETYALLYPQRAALIRRHGGVPPDAAFTPPHEALVQALLATRPAVAKKIDFERYDAEFGTEYLNTMH